MALAEMPRDHLTAYERAVCYYTLPRVTHPITYGIIVAYAVCLFEALGALFIGVFMENEAWTTAGTCALGGIVVLGLVIFTIRALLNEVRRQKTLALARAVPDAPASAVDPDLPNPFGGHLLLKHPLYAPGTLFACTDNDASICYFVNSGPGKGTWNIRTAQDEEACTVRVLAGIRSFSFSPGQPRRLSVYKNGVEIARIVRRYGLFTQEVGIQCETHDPGRYTVRQRGIYCDKALVGRFYFLRGSFYLDLQRPHFNEGLLAHFVTQT